MLKFILLDILACLTFQASCTETYNYAKSQSYAQSQSYSESKSNVESNSYAEVYYIGPSHSSDENSDEDCNIKCKKPNEVYEICPSKCPFRTCGIDDTLIDCAPSPRPGDSDCPKPACRCKNQFFRDDKGNCVRWNQCPKCTNPNEEYDPCDTPCPARRCDFDPTVVKCAAPPQVGDDNCVVGCRCIDGYLKDDNGVCVPKDQCYKCTNPNEVYDPCDTPCPARRCDFDPTVVKCAAPPQVGDDNCVVGCRCIDGYLKDDNGVCVPKDQCSKCKLPNEVYVSCPDCSPQTCETMNDTYQPTKKTGANCKPACRCKQGYFRNKIGQCIAGEDCLKCQQPHEYFSCGGACDNVCENLSKQNQTNCPIINKTCNKMCYCEEGYARNENKTCVPFEDCSIPPPKCPDNEEMSTCVQALCRAQNCADKDKPVACPLIAEGSCITGCVCKNNFLRARNGTCIPEDQCKNLVCTKPHEVLDTCIQAGCGPRNCSQLGKPISCPRIDPAYCKEGCVCEEGYVWDETGTCIKKTKCPFCGDDPNAISGCSMICSKRCSNYNSSKPVDCPNDICQINGCVCKKNYVHDDNTGKCVLPKQCTPVCKEHEVYNECINGGCDARNCSQSGYPVPCVKLDPDSCIKGCICENDFLRAQNGTCIPKTECPSCGGDPNAKPGCGTHCGNRCSTYKDKPTACRLICQLNGCDCKSGYVYDDKKNRCVKPEKCTPV